MYTPYCSHSATLTLDTENEELPHKWLHNCFKSIKQCCPTVLQTQSSVWGIRKLSHNIIKCVCVYTRMTVTVCSIILINNFLFLGPRMANFGGHAIPGSFFLFYGLWLTVKHTLQHYWKTRQPKGRQAMPPFSRKIQYIEGGLQICASFVGEFSSLSVIP